MNPTYAVYTHIDRPVSEVFQAIVQRETFTKVFAEYSSGDLIQGSTVQWGMGQDTCSVQVKQVLDDQRIELTFKPNEFAIPQLREGDKRDYEATLVFLFEPADGGGTMVTLCEYGWQQDGRSILQSYGHCSGWQNMLDCLKALLVYGIDLRTPSHIRPNYAQLWSA